MAQASLLSPDLARGLPQVGACRGRPGGQSRPRERRDGAGMHAIISYAHCERPEERQMATTRERGGRKRTSSSRVEALDPDRLDIDPLKFM